MLDSNDRQPGLIAPSDVRTQVFMAQQLDLVVIGGGVIGAGISWRAAQRGWKVAIVDAGHRDQGMASWAAAGMLAPVAEAELEHSAAFMALALESQGRWESFARELHQASGIDPGYDPCGSVLVALDTDDERQLQHRAVRLERLGLPVEFWSGTTARAMEPMLAPQVTAALLCADDAQVDNRAVVRGLHAAASAAGALWIDDTVTAVRAVRDRWEAVCAHRTLMADRVVLAAGAWSGSLTAGLQPVRVPIRPVSGQMLSLAWDPLTGRSLSRVLRAPDVYLAPKLDRVVVGATSEERGFASRLTGLGLHRLLEGTRETCPGLLELEIIESWVGLRPASRDNEPIMGQALPGLFVATGHYRNGIQLAPASIDRMAACLLDNQPEATAGFEPSRFFLPR